MHFKIRPFQKNEQRGLLYLLLIIIVLQSVYYFYPFIQDRTPILDISSPKIVAFQREIDSLKQIEIESQKPKIYPFNPSYITDYKGYKLGMNIQEIDKLLAYRASGRFINSTEEFQKVTGVNDSLLTIISPFFRFPDWVIAKNKSKKKYIYPKTTKEKQKFTKIENSLPKEKMDLNKATVQQLKQIHGIGDKLAGRIIKYREVLNGYILEEQLYEVWYLDKEVADRVLESFSILEKPQIVKLDINTASFKEILHLPYIDYKLTKKIFELRNELAAYQSLEQLKKIDSFPIEKFDRISLYLKAE